MATICRKCRHYIYDKTGDMWYWQFCEASPKPYEHDYVNDKPEYEGYERFEHCRDVNNGKCPLFEEKQTWRSRWGL